MRVDLEKVVRFSVIAEQGSFTAAARLLRVDQPWLSRQIKQLEEQLGFAVFERTTRRVELTEQGREFLPHALEVADLARKTELLTAAIRRTLAGRIRIGLFTTSYWAKSRWQIMERFAARGYGNAIDIRMGPTPELVDSLVHKDIDVVLGTTVAEHKDLDCLLIQRATPRLLIPKEHPLAARETLHMRDLAGAPLATVPREQNPANYDKTYGPFLQAGMELKPIVEGKIAIAHYAGRDRLLMLSYGDVEEPIAELGMVTRDVADNPAIVDVWLYKNKADDRELVRKFWATAAELSRALAAETA